MLCWAVLLQDTLDSALKSTGVDVNSLSKTTTAVTQTANEGVSVAKPFLSQAITFLTTTEPVSSCVFCSSSTGLPSNALAAAVAMYAFCLPCDSQLVPPQAALQFIYAYNPSLAGRLMSAVSLSALPDHQAGGLIIQQSPVTHCAAL